MALMASADPLSWLRATIEGDLAAAKAADEAAPGPWVNTGQDGLGDAWQIHGAPTGDMTWKYDRDTEQEHEVPVLRRVATLNYDDGGGVWEREAADHMVQHQPRDVIARCEAELALLERLEYAMNDPINFDFAARNLAEDGIELLMSGYRHREGFNPDWVND